MWKCACESALWSNPKNDRIEWEHYRKQHSGGDVKIIKVGVYNLVEFFKNWSPSGSSDLGLIRLSELLIKSMADQQMYKYNLTANRDLLHKAKAENCPLL